MKTMIVAITSLFFSFSFQAFGKTESLSDLGKLKRQPYKNAFMKKVVDADSIAKVFDVVPEDDYEAFKTKLAPDVGTSMTKLYKSKKRPVRTKRAKATKPRLRDLSILGVNKKEL